MLSATGSSGFREFKLVMLGSTTVGKSSIVIRLTRESFNSESSSTVGASFMTKQITVDDTRCSLQIWDTSGSERYRSMASMYFQGADAAVVVYDITSKESFEDVKNWLKELKDKGPENIVVALVGNKLDLEANQRVVSTQAGKDFASENNMPIFSETSAMTGQGIEAVFEKIAGILKQTKLTNKPSKGIDLTQSSLKQESNNKSCC